MSNRFEGIFYSPGRIDYDYGNWINSELKLSPYFWADFRKLIYMNDGLDFLVHIIHRDATKSYKTDKSRNKPNELHLLAVLKYLFKKMIDNNKVCELITHKDIKKGKAKQFIFTPEMGVSSIRKALDVLHEQGVIIKPGVESFSGNIFFLNIPYILKTLHDGLFEYVSSNEINDKTRCKIIWAIPQVTTLCHFWGRYFDGDFKSFVESTTTSSEVEFLRDWKKRCEHVVKLPAPANSKMFDMEKKDPYAIMYKDLYPGEVKEYVLFEGVNFPTWYFKENIVIVKGKTKKVIPYDKAATYDNLDEVTRATLKKYFGITVRGTEDYSTKRQSSEQAQMVQ